MERARNRRTKRAGGVVAALLFGSVVGISAVAAQDGSSITLDYDSNASVASSAGVICESQSEAGSGDEIDVALTGLEGGEECVIPFPEGLDCTVSIMPSDFSETSSGSVAINFPAEGTFDVVVEICCTDLAVSTVETNDATTEPRVEVEGVTETNTSELDGDSMPAAPAAEAQIGTPTFTG